MTVASIGYEHRDRKWRDAEGGIWEFWPDEDSWMWFGPGEQSWSHEVPRERYGPYSPVVT